MSDTWNENTAATEDTEDTDGERMVETPDSLRDEDPETPGGDRGAGAEDRPLGAEKFGTTHEEAELGESLDQRLAEEVPDGDGHDPVDDVVADEPELYGGERDETDDDVLGDAYGDPGTPDTLGDDTVGRVVAPDEGAHDDAEKDEVATDVGRDGGRLSSEEAALHIDPGT
jgi:hypothetical protein